MFGDRIITFEMIPPSSPWSIQIPSPKLAMVLMLSRTLSKKSPFIARPDFPQYSSTRSLTVET